MKKPDLLLRIRAALATNMPRTERGLIEEIDAVLATIDPDIGLQLADLVAQNLRLSEALSEADDVAAAALAALAQHVAAGGQAPKPIA